MPAAKGPTAVKSAASVVQEAGAGRSTSGTTPGPIIGDLNADGTVSIRPGNAVGVQPQPGSSVAVTTGRPVATGNGGVTAVDAAVATFAPITTRFVNGVTVVDRQTGTVFNGTVDLQPTFDRIAAGATGLSKNDGSVFRNGQGLLPAKSPGYYTEYVVPTPGISGPGPQRIVTGQSGEMFYTPDHYVTFIPVKKP